MKQNKYKIVEVKWLDAKGIHTDWLNMDKFKKEINVTNYSYGLLVYESKKTVCIVPHIADADGDEFVQGCGDMTINRQSIIHIKELRYGR